ncbi:uncharacterized protein LOC131878482 isoform X2 [Tigriopus californicus]|uniref:uncharacterized protein LOC131878482 isoform X2 n=1 Tax=Tigriopus californicus TaxID=6832 RepID=UPI0027D9FFC0|nr:uncharacterized protein LOC131878482 isoform X2 [Tigriopus californicus]
MATWLFIGSQPRSVSDVASSSATTPTLKTTTTSTAATQTSPNQKSKKKERWLVTRKTWRYMADAGKLLIPEALRKGKDLKAYSLEEMKELDDHYQRICDQLQEFVIWEGPLEDVRILLAKNRIISGAKILAQQDEDEVIRLQLLREEEEDEIFKTIIPTSSANLTDPGSNNRPFVPLGPGAALNSQPTFAPTNIPTGTHFHRTKGARRAGSANRRRSSGSKMVTSSASTYGSNSSSSTGHFGGGGHNADGGMGKAHKSKGGFFPSPYGTGMSGTDLPPFAPSQDHSGPAHQSNHSSNSSRSLACTGLGSSSGELNKAQPQDQTSTTKHPQDSKLRIMLPAGEKAPDGFTQVGKRFLPIGDGPNYTPPSSDSLLQLPSGLTLQELPASYATDDDREWYLANYSNRRRDSSANDSGVLSPSSPDDLFLEQRLAEIYGETDMFLEEDFEHPQNESGIGSGADSVGRSSFRGERRPRMVNVAMQTEPLPEEYYRLVEEERRQKEEEERLAREAEEKAQRELDEEEANMMGDSVMRYLKMVRRNSKSNDHKKANRFRSMNYDPTLRNIKAKYLYKEDYIEGMKHCETQAGDPMVYLLKRIKTPVDPTPDAQRKLSHAMSDFSDSLGSPSRRLSLPVPDEPLLPGTDGEKDFFSHLYSGDLSSLESGNVPEDYYNYLESWYKSQRGIQPTVPAGMDSAISRSFSSRSKSGTAVIRSRGSKKVITARTRVSRPSSQHSQQSHQQQTYGGRSRNQSVDSQTHPDDMQHTGIFIPVSALQNLRSSMPSLASSSIGGTAGGGGNSGAHGVGGGLGLAGTPSSTPSVSRSNSNLSKSSSFLASVISSKPFAGLGNMGLSGAGLGGVSTSASGSAKILSKKLWKPRSKSQSRPSITKSPSWTPQSNCRWHHVTNREVTLEPTNLLLLHDFERAALQRVALQKLNKSDLGTTIRIPKEPSDKGDSKQKKRGYLLTKRILRKEKDQKASNNPSNPNPAVFGVPLNQCVELAANRKRSTASDIPSTDELHVPTPTTSPPSGRSESRTSIGSLAGTGGIGFGPGTASDTRISSPIQSAGSCESLNNLDFRRSSLGRSQCSALDALSFASCFERLDQDENPGPFPNVPAIVLQCIRHLEIHGLRTVGIFRVSSSKKRVRQLREEFDNGGDIIFNEDIAVHDVATLLKEFFRDLPDAIIPKELHTGLLAIQKLSSAQEQTLALQRLTQLLPSVNRDTLFILLQFLGLVAENSEDRAAADGTVETGNKMDTSNLATLFAPNLLHTFSDEPSPSNVSGKTSFSPSAIIASIPAKQTPERMEYVTAVRLLIEKRDQIFELPAEELNDAYHSLLETLPEVHDALLKRRSALAGQEILEEDDEEYESPNDSRQDGSIRFRQRSRREGSEGSEGGGSTSSWLRLRDRSEHSDGGASSTENSRWSGLRNRQRDRSRSSVHEIRPPSAEGTLKFNLPKRSGNFSPDKDGQLSPTYNANEPPKRNAGSGRGIESVVYSPASSTRGTPSSEIFFGSGNTTPSLLASPPPHQSTFSTPTCSPPMSPPPLQHLGHSMARTSGGDPLVLQPVPPAKAKGSANVRAKSEVLEAPRLSDIESESATPRATPSREPKKYVRKRYTDSRHPTKELPDVRLEVPE